MDSLYIKNFKNIKELSINDLGRVNLIVGKNNVGKSTLLEALSIYVSNGDETWLRLLLSNRGETIIEDTDNDSYETNAKMHYISLFAGWEENYSKDYAIKIGEIGNDEKSVIISQVYLREHNEQRSDGTVIRTMDLLNEEDLENNTIIEPHSNTGISIKTSAQLCFLPYNRDSRGFNNIVGHKCPFKYLPIATISSINNASLFDRVSLTPEEDYIIEALNIINPDINRIRFVETNEGRKANRIAVVTKKNSDKRYRISSMGDGINRILTIILAMLNCKNGIMLLDEFETGLHYSVQGKLWEIIFMLAEKLNIQVFVTTHSSDCLKSFARANKNGTGRIIRLTMRDDNVMPTVYSNNEDIQFVIDNSIEIR